MAFSLWGCRTRRCGPANVPERTSAAWQRPASRCPDADIPAGRMKNEAVRLPLAAGIENTRWALRQRKSERPSNFYPESSPGPAFGAWKNQNAQLLRPDKFHGMRLAGFPCGGRSYKRHPVLVPESMQSLFPTPPVRNTDSSVQIKAAPFQITPPPCGAGSAAGRRPGR